MFQRRALKRRPAVCIVRHNYYPDSHVRRDAEALVAEGYDVTVISLRRDGQPTREVLDGVNVWRMPVQRRRGSVLRYAWEYGSFLTFAFFAVTYLQFRKRPQVVEVDNMPDSLVFSAIIPRLLGTPVILYIFDNMPELLMYLRNTTDRHPLVRLLAFQERISAAFANHVIVTQELPRRLALKRGVPPEKLSVVINCADEAIWSRDLIPTLDEDGTRFTIVTHGTILERYGIQTLIEAMPAVLEAVPHARVLIFGEGEYRAELERLTERLGLSDAVEFRGFVSLDELRSAVANADIGYVGMLNDLVLPNKLMEYITLGVPVVMSRWWTFEHYFPEDTVTYFEAGSASDLAEAIVAIYERPADARERTTRAGRLYQRYRWPEQRAIYLGVYDQVQSRRRHTRVVPAQETLLRVDATANVEAD